MTELRTANLQSLCHAVPADQTPSYCIFQEPWWLDAVAANAWQDLEVLRGGQVIARMPIVLRQKFGFRIIRQPPLTPTLGPWIKPIVASSARRLAREKALMNELIDQLPTWDYFETNLHHSLTNWLPFHWRGFRQTTRYTYILADVSDVDKVWMGLQENVRRNIRKARKSLVTRTDLPVDRLLDLAELTFLRQGQRLPIRRDVFKRIDEACATREARRISFAEDAKGRIHSVLYSVIDQNYVYYLLGGSDLELRGSGAQNLLLWEAICFASDRGLGFDFEGSMLESVERVFRGFGALQVPYLHIYCAKPLVEVLLRTVPPNLLKRLWPAV